MVGLYLCQGGESSTIITVTSEMIITIIVGPREDSVKVRAMHIFDLRRGQEWRGG